MPSRLSLLLLASLSATNLLFGQSDPKIPAGFVYSIAGKWQSAEKGDLVAGQPIMAGEAISLSSQGQNSSIQNSSIKITLLDGTQIQAECRNPGHTCEPIKIPEAAPKNAFDPQLAEILTRMGSDFTSRHAFSSGRAAGLLELNEAVIQDQSPNLSSVSQALPEGSYEAVFHRGAGVKPVRIPCSCKGSAVQCRGTVPSGLYELHLEQAGNALTSAATVMVAATNYPELSGYFKEATRIITDWPRDAQSQAKHYFLSSFLRQLQAGFKDRQK